MTFEKRVFSFWFGGDMSEDRELAYATIKDEFETHGIQHILITQDNLYDYAKEPIHESFAHLSATHKSDYLRCYFMHFIGGGYTDIKPISGDWHDAFHSITEKEYFVSGYREPAEYCIAQIPDKDLYRTLCANYRDMIGCCHFIFRENTPLTREWFDEVTRILDTKQRELKQYPGRHCREGFQDGYDPTHPYPIQWTEILGNVLHPLIYKYKDHVNYDCPSVIIGNSYR